MNLLRSFFSHLEACIRRTPLLSAIFAKKPAVAKYLVAGSISTGSQLLVLYGLVELLHFHYLIAAAIAFVVAVVISFTLQKFWTFADDSMEAVRTQFIAYAVLATLNLFVNSAILYLFVERGLRPLAGPELEGYWYAAAQALTSALIALESFFVYRFFIFGHLSKVDTGGTDVRKKPAAAADSLGLIIAVVGFGFLVAASMYCLTGKPGIWFDEGAFLHTGRILSEFGRLGVQTAPGVFADPALISAGYPFLVPLSVVISLFGTDFFAARMLMVVFIILFVTVSYLLARRLYGPHAANATLLLLVTFAPLYGNGKSVLGEVPGLFYLVLGLLLLERLIARSSGSHFLGLAAGMAFGFAVATKPIFLLLVPALLIGIGIQRERCLREKKEILLVSIGLLLSLSIWAGTQFGGDVSLGKIWAHYSNPSSVGAVGPVIWSNSVRFITESTPLHFMALLVLALGFLAFKRRERTPILLIEVVIAAFALLIVASYLRTAGWYRYFFPGHILLFIFVPGACFYFAQRIMQRSRLAARAIFLLPFMLATVQFSHLLYKEHGCALDAAVEVRAALLAIPSGQQLLFYNTPEIAFSFAGSSYFQYLAITPASTIGGEHAQGIQAGRFDRIVAPTPHIERGDFAGTCYAIEARYGNYAVLRRTCGR